MNSTDLATLLTQLNKTSPGDYLGLPESDDIYAYQKKAFDPYLILKSDLLERAKIAKSVLPASRSIMGGSAD
jgi:hypothetical protein